MNFHDFMKNHNRLRTIYSRDGTEEYMRRYYVWRNSRDIEEGLKEGPHTSQGNLFIHNFRLSDDPVFHSHPWDFTTLILKGGYWEHIPGDNMPTWRGPGSIVHHKATDYHWVELPENHNGNTWTLFHHGPRVRKWGFLMPDGSEMYWKDYIESQRKI